MRPWILCALSACAAPGPPLEPATGWIDGAAYPVARAWVYAQDNENQRWVVVLAAERGFPAGFSGDLAGAHADFGGAAHAVTSIGGDPGATYFEIVTDRTGAADCARRLGVEARPRVDPKLVLEARLELGAEAGGPRTARLVLENRGREPFSFVSGGEHGTPEGDPRFELQVSRDGVALPALAHPPEFGGMRYVRTLAPGESCAYELELAQWAAVEGPGLYRLRARCELEVQVPETGGGLGYDTAHLRWCQSAAAGSEFRVDR